MCLVSTKATHMMVIPQEHIKAVYVGMGLIDYHDYPDDIVGTPSHGLTLTCKRCGKKFDC